MSLPRARMTAGLAAELLRARVRRPLEGNLDRLRFASGVGPELPPRDERLAALRAEQGDLAFVYARLTDRASRQLLLRLAAFRTFGPDRVELPPGRARQAELVREAEQELRTASGVRDLGFEGWRADRFDLAPLGTPVTLDAHILNVQHTYQLHQYVPGTRGAPDPWVRPGDRVVDGGACWGDATLFLAHHAGADGRVLAYEFLPANLATLRANLEQNPALAERVLIEERALWDVPDETLAMSANGPASAIGDGGDEVRTGTIDDAVARGRLDRVDLIKLDVEGAELAALRGAATTLRAFRPRLAIAAYHRRADLADLVRHLDALGLSYSFALRHVTLHLEETVLYAWV